MIGGPSYALLRDIQTLFDVGTVGGLADRQLLDRFLRRQDPGSEAAFEVLVRRHGPMVLRVCRNVLRDWSDAEDAFQATFLVLARRGGSIRKRDSVESWLFGVACRVAARARVEAARRRAVERRGAQATDAALGPPPDDEVDSSELGPIVQEEVRRLPEKYRGLLVLCYWEGLTQEQAAAQLEIPLGTVRSRLARARDILRRRLGRRGVTSVAGMATAGLDSATAGPIPVAVPDAWVAATIKAVSTCTAGAGAGPAAAGAVSASAALLARSVVRSFFMMKLKTCAMGLAFVGVGAAGVILAAADDGQKRLADAVLRGASRQTAVSEKTKDGHAPRAMPDYVIEPPDLIVVEVLEALPGRPISGERLVRPDGKISLGFYGEVYVAGLSLAEAKEKIVRHLRGYINDDALGLTDSDDEPNAQKTVPPARLRLTDRVFVDVTAMNSKYFYVQGAVREPGRLPFTGQETVLDALNIVGGLSPRADYAHVVLHRVEPRGTGKRPVTLPVNVDEIVMGSDPTTNYQLLPGDRLVVPFKKDDGNRPSREPQSSLVLPGHDSDGADASRRFEGTIRPRRLPPGAARPVLGAPTGPDLRQIERRLDVLERKLDRVLEALEERGRGTTE
ncbi:MAG: sigma-70 family RNA polymerase sigma factor [Isosphaeraceae bacterium]